MPVKISLLIVENNPEFLDMLARSFFRRGYDVTPPRHPRQALCAAVNPPHTASDGARLF